MNNDRIIYQNSCTDLEEAFSFNEEKYEYEKRLLEALKRGSLEDVQELAENSFNWILPRVPEQIRVYRVHFIMFTALVSRTAVDCGCSAAEAFTLADSYIERCEGAATIETIKILLLQMLQDFSKAIGRVQMPAGGSDLVQKVQQYIRKHISEKITVEEMADDLGMSRNSLSGHFKAETGYLLSDYIQGLKIERAKYLISTTDYSMAEISALLGFSSQSHFQRIFKKTTGITPREFKIKNGRK